MNLLKLPYRWIVLLSAASAVVLTVLPARAFTDANADLKDAAADRRALAAAVAPALPQRQTAWVPPSAKRLDGFTPVLPPQRVAATAPPSPQRLARAEPAR